MERIVSLHIEKLPEGLFLATSNEVEGLVAQGRTITETLEIARDVAKKIFELREEISDGSSFQTPFEYPLIVEM